MTPLSGWPEGRGVRLGEEEEEESRRGGRGRNKMEEEITGSLSLFIFSVAFYPPIHRMHNPQTPRLNESRIMNLD